MSDITGLTVNYNTPDLLDRMLTELRKFYDFPVIVVDGSDESHFHHTVDIVNHHNDVEMHHFNYNIHHGPGLAYGFNVIRNKRIMVIDTDIEFINGGIIERMDKELKDESYGIGDVQTVNLKGFNVTGKVIPGDLSAIPYLHPAFMLVNRNRILLWPTPVKHGAPMIQTMIQIHKDKADVLQHADYVTHDFREKDKVYISHAWRGTVDKTGGYHL
jgi:hypothetical protein